MLVLIADKLPPDGLSALRELGVHVDSRPDLTAADLPKVVAETAAGILVVRSTQVTAAVFDAPNLSLVIRAGAGVNTIDLAAASRRGVFVSNCPGKNAIAVAELTMAMILALDRRLPEAVGDMRAGRWRKKHYGNASGLYGRRLGLVGLGAIGLEVAHRARAFGMQLGAYTRSLTVDRAESLGVEHFATLDDLLRISDVVSVHVPLRDATRHMIGASALALMQQGAILIHTARGGVVDDAALRQAVADGKIRAALDVFEDEPDGNEAAFSSELCALEGIYGTPHVGASTEQAQLATSDEMVRIVATYLQSGEVPNVVNLHPPRPARWTIIVRHRDRVGVLAGVLGVLREEQLNVQEMQNVVFAGNEAASATITLEREPDTVLLGRLRQHSDILAIEVRAVL
jgi:D-3-phosphoglycerate dehydrogenase